MKGDKQLEESGLFAVDWIDKRVVALWVLLLTSHALSDCRMNIDDCGDID